MAQNKNTPSMTIKHAQLKFDPLRIEYETYIQNRTGKRHYWFIPDSYADLFLEFLATERPEIFEKLQDDEVDLAVWDEALRLSENVELFVWTNVEILNLGHNNRTYCTNEIDRNKFPKLNQNHRNDNNV